MIFEALQSEFPRFEFHAMSSKIPIIPVFNLASSNDIMAKFGSKYSSEFGSGTHQSGDLFLAWVENEGRARK